MKNRHELLMPAGNLEKALYALEYGADAIYLGAKAFSLRARSSNFDFKEIEYLSNLVHEMNKKIYLVCNIVCHNSHLKIFADFFANIMKSKIDGIIVADPFIFEEIKKYDPNIELHISTQQSVCNSKSALFWKRNGASRIVLGREVSYEELKATLEVLDNKIEIEYFIHGAVCISYSGRCMMSNNFSMRDANVGGCAQSCRWNYEVLNEKFDKTFTMSAKDMSLLKDIDKLLKLPIASFKVEGRMKSIHYLATIASCYRKAIDTFYKNEEIDFNTINNELLKAENRITSNAFFDAQPNENKMLYNEDDKKPNQIFIFTITKQIAEKKYEIISRNYFTKNTIVEILLKDLNNIILEIDNIENENMELVELVNKPMKTFYITFDKDIPNCENKIGRIYQKL
ncbi:MAG: U32 family peptidase [Malacoplasma sp.]